MTSSSAPRKCKENITPTELMLIASLQKRKRTGKGCCCFPFFEKVTYSNERSTKLESLETLKKWLGGFTFSYILVEMFRFLMVSNLFNIRNSSQSSKGFAMD